MNCRIALSLAKRFNRMRWYYGAYQRGRSPGVRTTIVDLTRGHQQNRGPLGVGVKEVDLTRPKKEIPAPSPKPETERHKAEEGEKK